MNQLRREKIGKYIQEKGAVTVKELSALFPDVSLMTIHLKILFTNECIFNCRYCLNRSSNDVPRATFTPDEICELVIGFYRRNYIEGLFLSSGILKSPDYTMELLYQTLLKLRTLYQFGGYIHVEAIP